MWRASRPGQACGPHRLTFAMCMVHARWLMGTSVRAWRWRFDMLVSMQAHACCGARQGPACMPWRAGQGRQQATLGRSARGPGLGHMNSENQLQAATASTCCQRAALRLNARSPSVCPAWPFPLGRQGWCRPLGGRQCDQLIRSASRLAARSMPARCSGAPKATVQRRGPLPQCFV